VVESVCHIRANRSDQPSVVALRLVQMEVIAFLHTLQRKVVYIYYIFRDKLVDRFVDALMVFFSVF
jgi:hypothetical protein